MALLCPCLCPGVMICRVYPIFASSSIAESCFNAHFISPLFCFSFRVEEKPKKAAAKKTTAKKTTAKTGAKKTSTTKKSSK